MWSPVATSESNRAAIVLSTGNTLTQFLSHAQYLNIVDCVAVYGYVTVVLASGASIHFAPTAWLQLAFATADWTWGSLGQPRLLVVSARAAPGSCLPSPAKLTRFTVCLWRSLSHPQRAHAHALLLCPSPKVRILRSFRPFDMLIKATTYITPALGR